MNDSIKRGDPVKLIAFDLDGTILNSGKEVTPRTLAAIHNALSAGIHIVPATGRQFSDIPQPVKDIPSPFIITNNGAQVYRMPETSLELSKKFEKDTALSLLYDLRNFKGMIFGAYDTIGVFDNKGRGVEEGITGRKRNANSWNDYPIADIGSLIRDGIRFIKLVMIFEDPAERQRALNAFLPRKDLYVTYFAGDNIEIMPAGVSKGNALGFVAEKLGIDMKNVMALGDSDNDKDMIRKAGLGIAMGNATEELKAAADEVTLSCDEDGAALAIEKALSELRESPQ
ncbi:MAG: Cof-type HAD-IIB family hydrolase [Treponema sp.]|jgi:Cof subfamily protein (haloacid dehalogenase superfamily)|nr:Cof-type HAD-IIB family hydrolase [Treponema sp.]